jgi:hypothetical protein
MMPQVVIFVSCAMPSRAPHDSPLSWGFAWDAQACAKSLERQANKSQLPPNKAKAKGVKSKAKSS